MAQVRFNHMELTVAKGSLDEDARAELTSFYGGVLGWETMDVEIVGGTQFLMRPDEGQFILVAEHDRPMQSPGYDHLGLLCETRAEVDELLERCRQWQADDDRLRLKTYDDLDTGNLVVHAFYFKFLLPIWFDVQSMEHRSGGPSRRWALVDAEV